MSIKKYMKAVYLKNKKILIVGSSGLIGNTISKYFFKNNINLYLGISKKTKQKSKNYLSNFGKISVLDPLYTTNFEKKVISINPDLIINCIGITKHLVNKHKKEEIYFLNSVFPNLVSRISSKIGSKFIHISTDCIFQKINNKTFIANDIYGYSKYLGEKNLDKGLIIRTSTIGHEITNEYGLLEWFLNNKKNSVKGYKNAFFNGVTTLSLAEFIFNELLNIYEDNKVINLVSKKISKLEVLKLIKKSYNLDKIITITHNPKIDRCLNKQTKGKIFEIKKTWEEQIEEMKKFEGI